MRLEALMALALCLSGCGAVATRVGPVAPSAPLLATLPAGKAPILLALAPDGRRLYAGSADGKLTVIDTATRSAVATVDVSPFTSGIAVAADGSRVYVANLFGGSLAVLDTASNTPAKPLPLISSLQRGGYGRVAVAPDGSAVYVANQNNRMMTRVDLRSGNPTALTPDMSPVDLAFLPDGRRLLLAGCKNFCAPGAVRPFDTATGDFGSVAFAGGRPYRIVVSADGSRAYLANLGGATVSVLDGVSLAAIAQIPVSASPTSLALSRDGSRLYAAGDDTGVVSAIDTASHGVVAAGRVGTQAREVVVSPDGALLWVSTPAGIVVLEASALAAVD